MSERDNEWQHQGDWRPEPSSGPSANTPESSGSTPDEPQVETPQGNLGATAEGQSGAGPYGQPSATPYEQQGGDPVGNLGATAEGQSGPGPYGQPSATPYEQQGGDPYQQQGGDPQQGGMYPQQGDPYPQGYPAGQGYAQGGYEQPSPHQPGPGAYPPGGSAAPTPGQPPAYGNLPVSPSDEKLWGMLSHVGMLITGFIGPLIVWAIYKDRSPWIKANAQEALNFSILSTIVLLVGSVLTVVIIGAFIIPAWYVIMLVFGINGAIKANSGVFYRYPFNWRLVH